MKVGKKSWYLSNIWACVLAGWAWLDIDNDSKNSVFSNMSNERPKGNNLEIVTQSAKSFQP
jgi:hypothetical protein